MKYCTTIINLVLEQRSQNSNVYNNIETKRLVVTRDGEGRGVKKLNKSNGKV